MVWRLDFRETVETVLLYGLTGWTLTQSLDKKLDGTYTKMLRVVKNVTWWQRNTNEVLYARLPRILTTVRERRLRFGGHCWRSKNEVASDLVLWEPKHGKRSIEGQACTFVDLLEVHSGVPQWWITGLAGEREPWGVNWGIPSSSNSIFKRENFTLVLSWTKLCLIWTSFKFDTMIALMTLTFIQDHSNMRNQKLLLWFFCKFLTQFGCKLETCTTCWFVEAHAKFIWQSKMFKGENYLVDSIKNTWKTDLHSDTYELIRFKLGILPDMIRA